MNEKCQRSAKKGSRHSHDTFPCIQTGINHTAWWYDRACQTCTIPVDLTENSSIGKKSIDRFPRGETNWMLGKHDWRDEMGDKECLQFPVQWHAKSRADPEFLRRCVVTCHYQRMAWMSKVQHWPFQENPLYDVWEEYRVHVPAKFRLCVEFSQRSF